LAPAAYILILDRPDEELAALPQIRTYQGFQRHRPARFSVAIQNTEFSFSSLDFTAIYSKIVVNPCCTEFLKSSKSSLFMRVLRAKPYD